MSSQSDDSGSVGTLERDKTATSAAIADLGTALGIEMPPADPVTSPCPGPGEDGQERADYEIDVEVAAPPPSDALDRAEKVLEEHGYSTERTESGGGRYVVGERGSASLMLGTFDGPPARVTVQANTACYDT